MLHVQRPLSMPSSLVSDHHHHHPQNTHYQLPQLKEFGAEWHPSQSSRTGDGGLRGWPRGYTEQSLIPSPRLMAGTTAPHHPPGLPQFQDRSVNSAGPFMSQKPPHPVAPVPRAGHSRQNSRPQPFYQSYYSARPPSPTPKKDTSAEREQAIRRKASTDANSIASYLQVPPSINDSKGSLPEFAAQITCLFWFESSVTLQLIQDARASQLATTPLSPEAVPTTGFRKWVTTILSMTQVSQNVILLALMFVYRLKILNPGVKGKVGSEFRLLTVALMLGNKFLDDNTYTNKTWAEVSGISVQEIHVMEVEFLSNMRYSLYASEADWKVWHTQLGRFADYIDRASQVPMEAASRSLASASSMLNKAPHLPSPPVSERTSPAFPRIPGSSSSGLLHPTTMAPFLPPTISSPASLPPPESDPKQWTRKRSLEENHLEPPAKRMSSYMPSAVSSGVPTPSTLQDTNSPMPRLPPMPHVPNSHQHPTPATTGHQLPLPTTRAMANVFPGPSRWPQNGMLPSLQPAPYLSHAINSNSASPTNEFQSRQSPFAHASGTSSPTAYQFPQSHTPAGLSPSGMPILRNSPYKPVRGVNTLLVPPPSASVQHAPHQLSYEQMHYQPLGKPMSERRTGVLPYLPFEAWSQPHPMQPYLPHPRPSH